MDLDHPICFETWLNIPSLKCLMQRFHESATFPLRIRLPSTRIRWIRHTNLQLFEPALQSGNFWIRYESGIVWTLNPDIFLSGDVTRSSAVLYRERQSKMQISRFTTHSLLPIFTEESWVLDWIRIRVDVEIYESETKSCGFKNIRMRVDGT